MFVEYLQNTEKIDTLQSSYCFRLIALHLRLYLYLRFPSSRTRIVSASRMVGKTIDSFPIDRRSAMVNALSEITKCLSNTKRA